MADRHDMLGKTFFAIVTQAAPGTVNEGSYTVRLTYSDQRLALD